MKTEQITVVCKGMFFEIEAPKGDYITKIMKKTRKFYEQDFLLYLLEKYKVYVDKDDIIDVGAHIGNNSLFFNYFFDSDVFAFEPNVEILPFLNKNALDVEIFVQPVGLSEGSGVLNADYTLKSNSGTFRFNKKGKKIIPFRNLDFFGLEGKLLKIDVEGHEEKVLYGAENFIKDNQPVIVLESWDIVETMNTCGKFLFELGYKLEPIFKSKEKQLNLEFTPESFHG